MGDMTEDLGRVSSAVRVLLEGQSMMTRLATRPKVVLEFPDVGSMHNFHMQIRRAVEPMLTHINPQPESRSGEGVIEFEFYGITYVLICNQRFMTQSGKAVGYNSTNFVIGPDLPGSDDK